MKGLKTSSSLVPPSLPPCTPTTTFFKKLFYHIRLTRRGLEWIFGEPIWNICCIHKGINKSQFSRWKLQTGSTSSMYNLGHKQGPALVFKRHRQIGYVGLTQTKLENRSEFLLLEVKLFAFCIHMLFCELSTYVFAHCWSSYWPFFSYWLMRIFMLEVALCLWYVICVAMIFIQFIT